ncbi:GNAT family N-acetyltransferase [Endozoicomonas acroporae]|uniref:GNAT family N-acetyltransferase n=1 Tax=Endozoicomonas acroporae TaxID=1701104 RepID=UPI0013CF88BB|nr:GNAT family N-acetyltransferase [Endozoicomonas acroporae]
MFKNYWESDRLIFSEFSDDEAALAKYIFDKNSNIKVFDPTFRDWPLSVYEELIGKSKSHKSPDDIEAFYLRKITTKEHQEIGYIQIEINAPKIEMAWIPMLCIIPEHQGSGFGREIVESTIREISAYNKFKEVGLNVYAENIKAFRFWFHCGFNEIRGFEQEAALGHKHNCLVLYRRLE